jgi:hypothetical protein
MPRQTAESLVHVRRTDGHAVDHEQMFDGQTRGGGIISECSTARHAAESITNVRRPDTRRNRWRMFDGQARLSVHGVWSV